MRPRGKFLEVNAAMMKMLGYALKRGTVGETFEVSLFEILIRRAPFVGATRAEKFIDPSK